MKRSGVADRLGLYLPVLLMGLLAMATYWLVRSTPDISPPEPATEPQHHKDYFMHNFAVRTFDTAGQLKSEVTGTALRHFPDTNTLEIDQIKIRSFGKDRRLTTASAKHAITNNDASEVQLIGQALVLRAGASVPQGGVQPDLRFRGEFLHAFMNTERVTSHLPVELTRGQDSFTANRLDYDNLSRVADLRGRVRGVLVPQVKR